MALSSSAFDAAWAIPPTHDLQVRDLLARWQVLAAAGRFEWDDVRGSMWWQMPDLPQYAPLRAALADAGLDPDAGATPEHDATLASLHEGFARWSAADAAGAFVAGLWSAPAAWRSALPGRLLAQAMPEHPYTEWSADSPTICAVCGFRTLPVQVMQEWVFRLKEGIPLDGDPVGYAHVAAWFGAERPKPTEYDRWALGALRAVIRSLPAGTRYSAAAKAISSAKILRGARTPNQVLEALALCGVLASPEHPGMVERFTSYRERDQRPDVRVEVQAPLAWWDTSVGGHGIRDEIFDELFGALDIPAVSLDAPRPAVPLPAKDTIDGGLSTRARALSPKEPKIPASVGEGPAAAGDVYAVRLEPGRWATVYVHEVRERERPFAHVEYLAGIFAEMPTAAAISDRVQPRVRGRAATWVHSLEKTPWIRRIAQNIIPPAGDEPRRLNGSWQSAKGLAHLSGWHFDGRQVTIQVGREVTKPAT